MNNECQTISVEDACNVLGISRNLGYKLARQGKFPGAISIGIKRIRVSKIILDRLLGVEGNIQQADMPIDNTHAIKRLFSAITGKALEEFTLKDNAQDVIPLIKNYLPTREGKVLELRFGLGTGKMRTLEEVAKVYDVTRERIRQIEAKALRLLRHPSRIRPLKEYINVTTNS